jgi:formylglycine-generating enzyme required for sulfatase activity
MRMDNSNLPQHEVDIVYSFAIGRYEVTVEEFDAYVKETGAKVGGKCGIRLIESGKLAMKYTGTLHPASAKDSQTPYYVTITDGSYAQPGLPVAGRQPAVCVSRNEMLGYVGWLGGKTGKRYRLVTEAEWEYAARAGTSTVAFWGDDLGKACPYANFGDRASGYQAGMAAHCSEKVHPAWSAEAGSYKPNPWGLYDMAGNVQEEVEDCLTDNYDGAPADGSPARKEDCVLFVARGGDYELTQYSMRASERLFHGYIEGDGGEPDIWSREEALDERSNIVGFRVAVSLDDKAWDRK